MSEEQKEEKVEKKSEELEKVKADWDTEKQKAQQEHANYVKATEEKAAIAEELQAQLSKVAELEKQQKADTKDYPDLDPDLVDRNVIKSITQMKTELEAEKAKVAALEGKAQGYEKTEQQKAATEYKDRLIEKIHKPLDEEFGAQHRNAARELADELVGTQKEKEPQDAIEAMVLMRKCYKQVSEKKESKETVRTDTGKGGTAAPTSERKVGTTQEVLADMKKDGSWKE